MELLRLVMEASRARRHLEERMARGAGLTLAEFRLLTALDRHEATVSHLARRLGLTRQSVQRVADRLSERGLTRFTANPDHQRSPLLRPTEEGTRARERVTRELRDWEAGLEGTLEPEEVDAAELALRTLLNALS